MERSPRIVGADVNCQVEFRWGKAERETCILCVLVGPRIVETRNAQDDSDAAPVREADRAGIFVVGVPFESKT